MIRSFRHKGLRRLYEDDDPQGVFGEHVVKLLDILGRLDAARDVREMNIPGLRLHPIHGDLTGFWAVVVKTYSMWITSITIRKGVDRMPMKNPPHPGGFVLRECIQPLGLSVTEAACALGVSRKALSELVKEKRGISADMAVRLSQVFGGSPESWLI